MKIKNLRSKIGTTIAAGALFAGSLMPQDASALDAGYYARTSRLGNGERWVKVSISQGGMQRIDHATLASWGFTNPDKVAVYGFSGIELADNTFTLSTPDDLPLQYSEHIDGALYFYGEKDVRATPTSLIGKQVKRNYYSTETVYFLTEVDSPEYPKAKDYYYSGNTRVKHIHLDYVEREENLPGVGGVFYHSKPLNIQKEEVFNFTVRDKATDTATMLYLFVARTNKQVQLSPEVGGVATTVSSNNTRVSGVSNTAAFAEYYYNAVPSESSHTLSLSDNGEVTVTFRDPEVETCTYVAMDYAALLYERQNRFAEGESQLLMDFTSLNAVENIIITNGTENTHVWNVSKPLSIHALNGSFGDNQLTVSPSVDGTVRLMAFNPGATGFGVPTFAGTVDDCPNLHDVSSAPDMLIVTTDDNRPAAERLAALHGERQGLNVSVVNARHIYDEFSSGVASPIGIHRYVKMLYDRFPNSLKYVLLIGKGDVDNRNIRGLHSDYERIPTHQCEVVSYARINTKAYSSDAYYGIMTDQIRQNNTHKSTIDLGVGRIPAKTLNEAMVAVDKVERYYDDLATGAYLNRTYFGSDNGDQNKHLIMGENAVQLLKKDGKHINVVRGYKNLFSNDDILNVRMYHELSAGTTLWCYDGHGSSSDIGNINRASTKLLTFANHPIAVFSSCTSFGIDSEDMAVGGAVYALEGGPVAVIGTARTVYLECNELFYNGFARAWGGSADKPMTRLGDVFAYSINDALANAGSSLDAVGLNNLCYNLVGDPALPVGEITRRIAITHINDEEIVEDSKIEIPAGTSVTIKGKVLNAEGNTDATYDGRANVWLNDADYTTMSSTANGDTSMEVAIDGDILAGTGAEIKSGEFETTLFVPTPARLGTNRLTVVAANDDLTFGAGVTNALTIRDSAEGEVTNDDTTGPEVTELYLETPSFTNGDVVGPTPTAYVRIAPDPSGIGIATSVPGIISRMTLDESTPVRGFNNALIAQPDGSMTARINMANLADGHHTLEVEIADNLGNRTRRQIEFMVINQSLTAELSTDDSIFEGTLNLDLALSGSVKATRLVIEDIDGEQVVSVVNPTFPYKWEPAYNAAEGLYRARVYLTHGSRYGVSNVVEATRILPINDRNASDNQQ